MIIIKSSTKPKKIKRTNIKKSNETFTKEVYSLVGDEYEFIDKYINAKTKIKARHNICGTEWFTSPNNFLSIAGGCPKCGNKKISLSNRKSQEQFEEEFNTVSNGDYKLLSKYIKSTEKIKIRHNRCGSEYEVEAASFLSGTKCYKCQKQAATLKRTKTNSAFVKEVEELVGSEYTFIDEYKTNSKPINVVHNLCGKKYSIAPSDFLRGRRCSCLATRKKTQEEFDAEVYALTGEEYTFLEDYKGGKTKIRCMHNVCSHIWSITPTNFLRGKGCPPCATASSARKRATTHKDFKKTVYELVGDEYTVLGKYIVSTIPVKIRHNKCGYEWDVYPQNFLRRVTCPECSRSKGERRVMEWFDDNNITYVNEYSYKDLLSENNNPLRFDFAVFNKDRKKFIGLVEYDGEFHFKKYFKEQNFEKQKLHDGLKNQYCKENNIPLLRIPYWDFDNIEVILKKWLSTVGDSNE